MKRKPKLGRDGEETQKRKRWRGNPQEEEMERRTIQLFVFKG